MKAKLTDWGRFALACVVMVPVGLYILLVGMVFYACVRPSRETGGCGQNDWR